MMVIDWLVAHPGYVLLVYPLVTLVLSSLTKKPSPEAIAKWPRFSAFRRMLIDAGFNAPNFFRNFVILATGGKIVPPEGDKPNAKDE